MPVSTQGEQAREMSEEKLAKLQSKYEVICLIGAAAASMSGSLLIAAGWLLSSGGARQWLSMVGSVLLYLTIPIIISGGFFLDWMEKGRSQSRSSTVIDQLK
jgi:hypothetical protein